MGLSDPIKIRLNIGKKLTYENEAARGDKGLSTYLRERLEKEDVILDAIAKVRNELEDVRMLIDTQRAQGASNEGDSGPVMLEILYLLRTMAGPEKVNIIQNEIKRQGY